MDPEIYVFPQIKSTPLKILASSILFLLVLASTKILLPQLLGWQIRAEADLKLLVGPFSINLPGLLIGICGFLLFIYGSYHAWRATLEKNSVEDPTRRTATRILDSGYYARVRHPMYGMFILANAGLGLAMHSILGLVFSLLTLVLFLANGILEEQTSLIPQFRDRYRAYMRRVPRRYFTPVEAILLVLALVMNIAGLFIR